MPDPVGPPQDTPHGQAGLPPGGPAAETSAIDLARQALGRPGSAIIAQALNNSPHSFEELRGDAELIVSESARFDQLAQRIDAGKLRTQELKLQLAEEEVNLANFNTERAALEPQLAAERRALRHKLQQAAAKGILDLPLLIGPRLLTGEQLSLLGISGEALAIIPERDDRGFKVHLVLISKPGDRITAKTGELRLNQREEIGYDPWRYVELIEQLGQSLRPQFAYESSGRPAISTMDRVDTIAKQSGITGRILREFRKYLDPEIAALLEGGQCDRLKYYNFCAAADGKGRIYRAQALAALPFFAPALTAWGLQVPSRRSIVSVGGMGEAIDAGQSPQKLLADFYGCSRSVIRRLAHAPEVESPTAMTGNDFLRSLPLLDVNLIPMFGERQPDEHRLLGLLLFASELERSHGANVRCGEVVTAIPRGWQKFVAENRNLRVGELRQALGEVRDFLRSLFDVTVSPELRDVGVETWRLEHWFEVCAPEIFRTIFPSPNPITILNTVADWHEVSHDWPREVRDIEWPALTAPMTAPSDRGGCRLRFLTTELELVEEGARQRHCVGGYGDRCLAGAHIGTLRDERNTILSTVELTLRPDGRLALVQHLGKRNGPVPAEARASLEWFLEQVDSGDLRIDRQRLEAERRKLTNYSANDKTSERFRETQFARYQRWMPEEYGHLSRVKFLLMSGTWAIVNLAKTNREMLGSVRGLHDETSPVHGALHEVAKLFRGSTRTKALR